MSYPSPSEHTHPSHRAVNREVADAFRAKAERLKLKTGETSFFRARAYEQAAEAVDKLEESLEEMYKRSWIGGIQKIPGIGNRIAHDIERELRKRGVKR
ncbi:MAG: helix-hairpin-helix domain-containing protein [Patescibacteria group bacterium]|jgi:DNA polymerase/3'-5' exonuclease PolX